MFVQSQFKECARATKNLFDVEDHLEYLAMVGCR